MLERELFLRELDIKFFKWLMKEEFRTGGTIRKGQ